MSIQGSAREARFSLLWPFATGEKQYEALTAELKASHAREEALRTERRDLIRRQTIMADEFGHRLVNSLQVISSLLSLQSAATTTPEASAQLMIAAHRVAALGRVHRRLHLLDHQDTVEFTQYLKHLCEDLTGLLLDEQSGHVILVQGETFEMPAALGIPLGFIVNELITNSVKYAKGNIIVRFETMSPSSHLLSVLDEGPGLPAGFDPANSKGLGMKIVRSLVKQIGGELLVFVGDNGSGSCFTVAFSSQAEERSIRRMPGRS